MAGLLIKLFPALSILLLISCDNVCHTVECKGRSEFVELRLLRNEVNALLGPDAFLTQDSIHAYSVYSPGVTIPIGYKSEDQSISLFIEEGAPVVPEINNTIQDTFSIITTLFGSDDCCLFYRVDTVRMNDSVICSGFCVVPIDVEI